MEESEAHFAFREGRMKKWLLAPFLVALIVGISCLAEGWNWVFLGQASKGKSKLYLDLDSIRTTKGGVRLWMRSSPSLVLSNPSGYDLVCWEIRCDKSTAKMQAVIVYDSRGSIIKEAHDKDVATAIPPGSAVEMLAKVLCKEGKK